MFCQPSSSRQRQVESKFHTGTSMSSTWLFRLQVRGALCETLTERDVSLATEDKVRSRRFSQSTAVSGGPPNWEDVSVTERLAGPKC